MAERRNGDEIGRHARSPWSIPWAGWSDVISRVVSELSRDRASMASASVAYFAMLALFPALIATFSLYALFSDPDILARQISDLTIAMPGAARSLIVNEVKDIASSTGRLSVGFVFSLLFSFLAASSGISALIDSVNMAYDEEETRGYLVLRWLAFRFTVGIAVFICLAVTSLTALPAVSAYVHIESQVARVLTIARWPALGVYVMVGLALLYRYAPNRTPPRFRWVSVGALVATLIWLGASFGLSVYAENFAHYNKTYGTIGAVVVLSLWFYISSFAIVLGAELNAELEHQTEVDTTAGPAVPMGRRKAVMADTLGESTPARPVKVVLRDFWRNLRTPRRDKRRHRTV